MPTEETPMIFVFALCITHVIALKDNKFHLKRHLVSCYGTFAYSAVEQFITAAKSSNKLHNTSVDSATTVVVARCSHSKKLGV
ncbi:Heat shock protein 90-6 [Trichinella spiralis]|uniref:Heat shock protein 90-6 n=1 Tax=Trichinella spiralis TaxID=6334 RepID=A0ABR3K6B9_TRISP